MAKQTPEQRAARAKAQAEAREAEARARLTDSKRELADLLKELLTEVSRSPGDDIGATSAAFGERKPLRKFSALTWVKATPSVVARFREGKIVPDEMWVSDSAEDGTPLAIVACPCGSDTVARFANYVFCKGDDCQRGFLFDGRVVYAIRLSDEESAVLHESPED